jgi:hypothetical protein
MIVVGTNDIDGLAVDGVAVLGFADGVADGDVEGIALGRTDGEAVGFRDGIAVEGYTVLGDLVGATLPLPNTTGLYVV